MTPIPALLEEIRTALAGFVDLLREETAALSGRDPDRLAEVSERKSRQALALGRLWSGLAHALGEAAANPDAIAAQLGRHGGPSALQTWAAIRALGQEAERINRENGRLIEEQLQHTTRALEVLKSAAQQNRTYGPDGLSTDGFSLGRSIDKA